MIDATQLSKLSRFPCASWAIWPDDFDQKSHNDVDELTIQFFQDRVELLKPNPIFVGLNPSGKRGEVGPSSMTFKGFHTLGHRGDQALMAYIQKAGLKKLSGCYMTDLNCRQVDTGSVNVSAIAEDIGILFDQLQILGKDSYQLICFGNNAFSLLNRRLDIDPATITTLEHSILCSRGRARDCDLTMYRVWHYSTRSFNFMTVIELKAQLHFLDSLLL